jgi:hypothetical protein
MDDKLYEYVVAASAREVDSDEEEYQVAKASLSNKSDIDVATNDVIVDGKPRMLLLTAWIVHEGRNLNGQVFIKEEISQRVQEGLFAPPHAGMIDFDHDFEPRGFWYKTSFAYDAKAEKWGVLAYGAVWAWRFSELADYILAEIQRTGSVPVSMAAKAESIEFTQNYPEAEDEHTTILHNPVFLTTSILDVPPADPHARAVGTEEPERELDPPAKQASQTETQGEAEKRALELSLASENEERNMEEKLTALQESLTKAEIARDEALSLIETFKAEIEQFKAEIEQLKADEAAATVKVTELEVALSAASDTIKKLEEDLATSKESLEQFETEKVEAEKEKQLAERLAELPETVRENLEEHEKKDTLVSYIKEATEEQWETIKQSFALSVVTEGTDYIERSDAQGHIPSKSGDGAKSGIAQFIH